MTAPPLRTPSDDALALSLAREIPVHPLVARVLFARGGRDPEALRRFLNPRLAELTKPDAMADRDLAAGRLADAVRRRERIAVFGDYDVDGITSCALLTRALRSLGGEVSPLVASRFDGGYGLSDAALDRVLATRPAVLVTCDCGTSDHPRLERARAHGVETIVVDHHKVPSDPLPAVAFLNPHRPDCRFPYKHMASVGLAFSIAAAVRARCGSALDLRPLLDLVALGTVADVAPLDGDNRALVRAGLQRVTEGHASPGVKALVRAAKLRHRVTARDVAFSLAPALNAAGRLGPATPTLELLLADDEADATRRAMELSAMNLRRRELSGAMVDAATEQVRRLHGDRLPPGIVVAGEGWHQGMGGIVAGRLVERFGVPVVVVAIEGGVGVGSVRAPRGTRVYDAVHACSGVLEGFGGHDAAAGLKVRGDQIDALRSAFAEALRGQGFHPHTALVPAVDAELRETDLGTPGLGSSLALLDPTGEGNPDPVVSVDGARVSEVRAVGEQHLRVGLSLGRGSVSVFVRDGAAKGRPRAPAVGSRVSVVGTLRPDAWTGPDAVQIDAQSAPA